MDLSSFFKLLLRHKYTLVVVPVIAVIITFFLVRNQPDSYISESQIATGIVDQTQSFGAAAFLQESKITQDFSNLTAMLRSKRMLDQISYQLMIHDLTNTEPYRKPSKLLKELNSSARAHAVKVYKEMYSKMQPLSLFNSDQNGLHKLLASMKYDDQSLTKTLSVYRADNSDYINISFESEDPELSAFVVNSLSNEFIKHYTTLVKVNQRKAINFYSDLLQVKQDTLDARMAALKNYKIRNRVLNLDEQAKALYGQIADFETRREEAGKETITNLNAAKTIDQKFTPNKRGYAESAVIDINQKIVNVRAQLQDLNYLYVQTGFKPVLKNRIDSLQRVINGLIGQSADKYSNNPLAIKQDLIEQRSQLEIQHEIAKSSVKPIGNELSRLNNRITQLVPHEAVVQAYESSIQIAKDEYMEILAKYNQTLLDSNFTTKLRQIEVGMPGAAQPSKKMLLVIISGIISFVFCLVVLFLLFFFDDSVKTPRQLADKTKMPVLGHIYKLTSPSIDLKQVWTDNQGGDHQLIKNLLQSIRFEVDTDLQDGKILLINSLAQAEGKTFLAINLAYAYAQVNKKVLLIDGNFTNTGITEAVKPGLFIEDILTGHVPEQQLNPASRITVAGNKGGDISLMQIAAESQITSQLQQLKAQFDVVIIESSALCTLNKAKEWIGFADKIVTVFKAGRTIKNSEKPAIDYLTELPGKFSGWVLNEASKNQVSTGS